MGKHYVFFIGGKNDTNKLLNEFFKSKNSSLNVSEHLIEVIHDHQDVTEEAERIINELYNILINQEISFVLAPDILSERMNNLPESINFIPLS